MLQQIPLSTALQLAAQEKGFRTPTIRVTFKSLARGGKFRVQIHAKGQTYMISGKDGLVSKTRKNSTENMILAELREKIVRVKVVKPKEWKLIPGRGWVLV
ncbi:MAG: hypothetical protein NTX91_04720 [candidate division SR1 bacterium]|nr:hypothetical protein [candidate division SR1 bacterium]